VALVLIGDVHGKKEGYFRVLDFMEDYCSLQIGDMDFDYSHLESVDSTRHKFLPGNHDNYDKLYDCPNCIGDYGFTKLGDIDFFFVRGAFSIDKHLRTPDQSWWEKEELTISEGYDALDLYAKTKPSLMITHDCPTVMRNFLVTTKVTLTKIETRTGQLLQQMYEIHQPDIWIFGHWHVDIKRKMGRTNFRCLGELSHMKI